MTHYSKVSYNIKSKIINFSKKVSIGLSKPNFKFVCNMLFGIISSTSSHLSEISRSLNEPITLKKTIERLSNRLKAFAVEEQDQLFQNFINETKSMIDKRTIFCIDHSDINKKHSIALEGLGKIRDGSTGETNINGYNMFEIAALTHEKAMPLPVYSKVYSNTLTNFISETDETLQGLKYITNTYGSIGIRALDRGYDNIKFFNYFSNHNEAFVIRAKTNRNVIHNGKTLNILELAFRFKGRYSLMFTNKEKKTSKVKVSSTPIRLPGTPDRQYYLVMVFGFGKIPMLLITNIEPKDKRLNNSIVKIYLKRWRIEEYFKFKKQQFDFENLRVRSFQGICTLNKLVTICVGFICLLAEKESDSVMMEIIDYEAKRLTKPYKFNFYRIADGIFNIVKMTKTGINAFMDSIICRKGHSEQLKLPIFDI